MLKQIDKMLLEKYPLLWNMRVVTFGLVILLVHLLHLVIGYLTFSGIERMRWNSPDSMFFSSSFALFSIIGSFVIFILWLVRYLRNNAFKSFYPFSNGHLFTEFLILFAVTFLNITYYYSYTFGFVLHARTATNFTMAQRDQEIYRHVAVLLEEGKEAYSLDNRCWPDPFPLQKHFIRDSVGADSAAYINSSEQGNFLYVGHDDKLYGPAQVKELTGGYQYSYLNRCDYQGYDATITGDDAGPNRAGSALLLSNDPVKLKKLMTEFLSICDRYHVKYKIDAEEWFRWVYNPPYYPVKYTLRNLQEYDDTNFDDEELITTSEYNPNGFYLQHYKLQRILNNTFSVHRYTITSEAFSIFFYCAMGFAIMVFTFRATSRRVWLISLIGMCLLSLLVGAVSAMLISGTDSGMAVMVFYLVLIAIFLVMATMGSGKTVSGVNLVWFIWTAPFILPIITAMWMIGERAHYKQPDGTYQEPPFSSWVTDHYGVFFVIIMSVYILIMLALTPLCRKWQAMAED